MLLRQLGVRAPFDKTAVPFKTLNNLMARVQDSLHFEPLERVATEAPVFGERTERSAWSHAAQRFFREITHLKRAFVPGGGRRSNWGGEMPQCVLGRGTPIALAPLERGQTRVGGRAQIGDGT